MQSLLPTVLLLLLLRSSGSCFLLWLLLPSLVPEGTAEWAGRSCGGGGGGRVCTFHLPGEVYTVHMEEWGGHAKYGLQMLSSWIALLQSIGGSREGWKQCSYSEQRHFHRNRNCFNCLILYLVSDQDKHRMFQKEMEITLQLADVG